MKKIFFLLIYLFSFTVSASSDRIALVIGNSKYTELGSLVNPINDAKSINKTLQEMGYKTKLVLDATESTIRKDLRSFASESDNASIALVFFAGHGAQINGENYLLPVDIEIPKRESDIQLSALKVDDLINSIKSKTKVIFLDACRDNPALIKNLTKGRGSFRSGLAPTNTVAIGDQSSGIFIAYATDAGNIASDGLGQINSPFTTALLKYIKQPVSIDDMFSMVTKEVRQTTKNVQKPYKYASLDGIICLPGKCERFFDSKNSELTVITPTIEINKKLPDSGDSWAVFESTTDKKNLIHINLKSIGINGTRVSTTQKWVDDDKGTYEIITYVYDCKSRFGNVIKSDKYDSNGKLIESSQWGNALTVDLTHDYSKKGSIAFGAIEIACNPDKNKPIISGAQLNSPDWEKFYTLGSDVVLYFLKNSKRTINSDDEKNRSSNFFSLLKSSPQREVELITKITFPRTKGSDFEKLNAGINMGLKGFKSAPYATSLVTKARFLCDKNVDYSYIENWYDQDGKVVGIMSYSDLDPAILAKFTQPSSVIMGQLLKLACS